MPDRKSIDEETLQDIKEKVRKNRIKEFKSRFEGKGPNREVSSPFVQLPGDLPGDELAFGEAVMEGGKLLGFNMVRRDDPKLNRENPPVLDENGKQLFMTVEEFFDLHESQFFDCITHEQIDKAVEEEFEHRELNKTTLGRVRMKAVETVEKATGVKLPKAPLSFKEKFEKPASEFIDSIRKRRMRE